MRVIFFITILLSSTTVLFSQNYMDDITNKSCECLGKVADTVSTEMFNIEVGLCMMEAAGPYKKRLRKDHGIDLDKIDAEQGEELGRLIGLRMASMCPDALMKMVDKVNQVDVDGISENIVTGEVTAINDDKFIEFSIRNEVGKISKYYWFTFIESNIELSTEYETLKEKSVQIHYTTQEFFDSRIGEYRTFNIIEKLILTDN